MTRWAVSIEEWASPVSQRGRMIVSKIDWTVMWKFFHYQFCWIYLSVGVSMRLFLAQRLKTVSLGKAGFYAIISCLLASFLSNWFPVIPCSLAAQYSSTAPGSLLANQL